MGKKKGEKRTKRGKKEGTEGPKPWGALAQRVDEALVAAVPPGDLLESLHGWEAYICVWALPVSSVPIGCSIAVVIMGNCDAVVQSVSCLNVRK